VEGARSRDAEDQLDLNTIDGVTARITNARSP
jgi:hypothetical protein